MKSRHLSQALPAMHLTLHNAYHFAYARRLCLAISTVRRDLRIYNLLIKTIRLGHGMFLYHVRMNMMLFPVVELH